MSFCQISFLILCHFILHYSFWPFLFFPWASLFFFFFCTWIWMLRYPSLSWPSNIFSYNFGFIYFSYYFLPFSLYLNHKSPSCTISSVFFVFLFLNFNILIDRLWLFILICLWLFFIYIGIRKLINGIDLVNEWSTTSELLLNHKLSEIISERKKFSVLT